MGWRQTRRVIDFGVGRLSGVDEYGEKVGALSLRLSALM